MAQAEPKVVAPEDRRRYRRISVLWEAQLQDGGREENALVLNISDGGALIRVTDPMACSNVIDINVARMGNVAADVVWRSEDAIGVSFLGGPDGGLPQAA